MEESSFCDSCNLVASGCITMAEWSRNHAHVGGIFDLRGTLPPSAQTGRARTTLEPNNEPLSHCPIPFPGASCCTKVRVVEE
jgi:hypothetical protein